MKKIVSVLLVTVLLVAVMPFSVFAASDANGKCGDNLTWSFDKGTGELIISGTGEMYDYSWHDYEISGYTVPWYDDLYKIKTVTIKNGVTSIGESAFQDSGLVSITIPDSVTSIGWDAFMWCYGLESVTIPDGVTKIAGAFSESGLKSVTVPGKVTDMSGAFRGCGSLTEVTLKNGITAIGESAFASCKGLSKITIPNSVTSIGDSAFAGSKIANITFGTGLKSIGNSAFYNCDSLTGITIPSGITKIEKGTFSDCDNLIRVTIPDGVTSIGDSAFSGCDSLVEITVPKKVTSIGEEAFGKCESLEEVKFMNSDTIDMAENALSESLKAMICCEENSWLHSYADTLGMRVCFYDSKGTPSFEVKNNVLVSYRGNSSDVFVSSAMKIGYGAFENSKKVKNIELSSAVNRIYDRAFKDCSALNTVIIPQSVASIGDNSFDGCGNLTIYGYAGSYAESYAKKQGIKFEYITLTVSADTYAVNVLDTLQLEASYNILLNEDESIIWSCDDNGVASVSQTGEVTALKAGEAVVTATAENGLYATCVIKVGDSGNTRGDLNGDGIANSTDALIVLQHTVGKITIDEKLIPLGDVNDDTFVNSTDALKILQFTVGKINKL